MVGLVVHLVPHWSVWPHLDCDTGMVREWVREYKYFVYQWVLLASLWTD